MYNFIILKQSKHVVGHENRSHFPVTGRQYLRCDTSNFYYYLLYNYQSDCKVKKNLSDFSCTSFPFCQRKTESRSLRKMKYNKGDKQNGNSLSTRSFPSTSIKRAHIQSMCVKFARRSIYFVHLFETCSTLSHRWTYDIISTSKIVEHLSIFF